MGIYLEQALNFKKNAMLLRFFGKTKGQPELPFGIQVSRCFTPVKVFPVRYSVCVQALA